MSPDPARAANEARIAAKDKLDQYDRIPDATVESIAKGGRSYPHEARNMARELIKLRAQTKEPEPVVVNPYTWGGP